MRRGVALVMVAIGIVFAVLQEPVAFVLELIRRPRGRGRHASGSSNPSPPQLQHETGPQTARSRREGRTGTAAEPPP